MSTGLTRVLVTRERRAWPARSRVVSGPSTTKRENRTWVRYTIGRE